MNRPGESSSIKPTAIAYLYSARGGVDGIEATDKQRRKIYDFCIERKLSLDRFYIDYDHCRRQRAFALQQLIQEDGPQVLLVASIDRLTRDAERFTWMMERVLAGGRHLVSVDGQIDTRTQPGRWMVEMMRICGEVERDKVRTLH